MVIGHFRRKNNQNQASDGYITLQLAERIKIDGLKDALLKLQSGTTAYPFIGITSNGIDCIYFYYKDSLFNIEFEAVAPKQQPYIDKLKLFAESNNITYKLTSYKDKATNTPIPVIHLQVNATVSEASFWGEQLQKEIFDNNDEVIYDVVP